MLWAAMYLHRRKWKAVNVGCEVCVLVVETPSFYPAPGVLGPAFDRSYRQRTAILTLPGQAPAKIPDKPFRNGAGESVPPDGTYVPKMR